jgi:hypothetical protein
MTVPILIPWDLYQGKLEVWSECLLARVRRAVLLPRLDTIFGPTDEDPARETPYNQLNWRLISPTETDWTRYRGLVEKQAKRAGLAWTAQRVENMARWVGGQPVVVPQYHLWLYSGDAIGVAVTELYGELDARRRRELWRWLLAWTSPAEARKPRQ